MKTWGCHCGIKRDTADRIEYAICKCGGQMTMIASKPDDEELHEREIWRRKLQALRDRS